MKRYSSVFVAVVTFAAAVSLAPGCGGARSLGEAVDAERGGGAGGPLSAAAPALAALHAHLDAAAPVAGAPVLSLAQTAEALRRASAVFPPVLRAEPAAGGAVAAAWIPGLDRPQERVVLAAVGTDAGVLRRLAEATASAVRSGDLAFPSRTLAFVAAPDGRTLTAHLAAGPPPLAVVVLCAADCPGGDVGGGASLVAVVDALAGTPAGARAYAAPLPAELPAVVIPTGGATLEDGERAALGAAAGAYLFAAPPRALLEQIAEALATSAPARLAAQRPAVGGVPAAGRVPADTLAAWWREHQGAAAVLDRLALPAQRPVLARPLARLADMLRRAHADAAREAGIPRTGSGTSDAP